MYKFSYFLLPLLITFGFCVSPQISLAEPIANEVTPVKKSQVESWKKVRYENWTIYIPTKEEKSCPSWEPLFKKHGLPVKIFSYIAWRESRCMPKAIGWNYKKGKSSANCRYSVPHDVYKKCDAVDTYDSGLLQINSSWMTVTSQVCLSKRGDLSVLKDPDCNVRVAKFILENGGLGNWGFRRK